MKANPVRVGLVFAVFVAVVHVGWVVLVAINCAQWLVDYNLYLHFVKIPVTVEAFDAMRAATLVGATFVVGFGAGLVAAIIWNIMHR